MDISLSSKQLWRGCFLLIYVCLKMVKLNWVILENQNKGKYKWINYDDQGSNLYWCFSLIEWYILYSKLYSLNILLKTCKFTEQKINTFPWKKIFCLKKINFLPLKKIYLPGKGQGCACCLCMLLNTSNLKMFST